MPTLLLRRQNATQTASKTLQDGRQRLEQVGKETLKVVLWLENDHYGCPHCWIAGIWKDWSLSLRQHRVQTKTSCRIKEVACVLICIEPRERSNGRKGEGVGALFVIFSFSKTKIPDKSSNLLEERFNLAHGFLGVRHGDGRVQGLCPWGRRVRPRRVSCHRPGRMHRREG